MRTSPATGHQGCELRTDTWGPQAAHRVTAGRRRARGPLRRRGPRWRSAQRAANAQPAGFSSRLRGAPGIGHEPSVLPGQVRGRGQQPGGVGVAGSTEDRGGRGALDDASGVHHVDAVAHRGREVQVVGDEQHAHRAVGLQAAQDPEDLGLGGDVQGRGRLVAEQQARVRRSAHRRSSPAAASRPRARAGYWRRWRSASSRPTARSSSRARVRARSFAPAMVEAERLGEEVADPPHRVDARPGVLEDHRDLGATQREQVARGRRRAPRSRRPGRRPRPPSGPATARGSRERSPTCPIRTRRPGRRSRPASTVSETSSRIGRSARPGSRSDRSSISSSAISRPAPRSGRRTPRRRC